MTELIDPTPGLPDDTPTDRIRFPTRIRKVWQSKKLKTVGEIRDASDKMLMTLPDLGRGSIAFLRKTLGMPSSDRVTASDEGPSQ
jgi:hypothetical protein